MGWHKFWNPHCTHCIELERERKQCASCDTLRDQVNSLIRERDKLLDQLLGPKTVEPSEPMELPKPLVPTKLPWNLKRQQLELADLEKAHAMKLEQNQKKSVAELEDEVGISNG